MTKQKNKTAEDQRKRELLLIRAGRAFQLGLDITARINETPEVILRDSELDALRAAVAAGRKYRELVDFTQPGSEDSGNILFMGLLYQQMVISLNFYSRRENFERAVEYFRGLKLSPRIFDQDSPYQRQLKQAKIKRKRQDYN